jgi:acetolactate decarboxylase
VPRLTCEISQSLWDALHRASRDNRETLSHIVSRALADRLQVEHETLFQVSTAGALVKGVFDGAVSISMVR